jgi:hypothetical protein
MFLVSDTLESRHKRIRSFLDRESVIAILLAAADFEWTVRRAILALGRSPTKCIRENVLANSWGIEAYKSCWKQEVEPRFHKRLAELVSDSDWQFFKSDAYPLRDRLIHGIRGTVGGPYARKRVEAILGISKALVEFADDHCEPVYGRRIRRSKPRG